MTASHSLWLWAWKSIPRNQCFTSHKATFTMIFIIFLCDAVCGTKSEVYSRFDGNWLFFSQSRRWLMIKSIKESRFFTPACSLKVCGFFVSILCAIDFPLICVGGNRIKTSGSSWFPIYFWFDSHSWPRKVLSRGGELILMDRNDNEICSMQSCWRIPGLSLNANIKPGPHYLCSPLVIELFFTQKRQGWLVSDERTKECDVMFTHTDAALKSHNHGRSASESCQ